MASRISFRYTTSMAAVHFYSAASSAAGTQFSIPLSLPVDGGLYLFVPQLELKLHRGFSQLQPPQPPVLVAVSLHSGKPLVLMLPENQQEELPPNTVSETPAPGQGPGCC